MLNGLEDLPLLSLVGLELGVVPGYIDIDIPKCRLTCYILSSPGQEFLEGVAATGQQLVGQALQADMELFTNFTRI